MTEALDADWDVIVIGTGIGGGTAGRALAEAGRRVLFLEAGRAGHRREETRIDAAAIDPVARAVRGLWPDPLSVTLDGETADAFAPLGAGIGGSSVFYAATLEAPEPHDVEDRPGRPHPTGGWPISWADLAPDLARARALYHVHGTADPLSEHAPDLPAPPPLAPGERALADRLTAAGLHPYRLHAALRYLSGCTECLGRKCPRDCKMDGRSAGVEPALATGRAAIVTGAEVTRLIADGDRVTGVELRHGGASRTLAAPQIVLAAGALNSPRLMLASAQEGWPDGLGNRHGHVGRGLMFHLNETFALWPGRAAAFDGPSKAIGFRDLYFAEGQRLGMVQAMGIDVGYGEILHVLRQRLARSPLRRLPAAGELARLPAAAAARAMGTAKVFVGLLEDLPDPGNRVRSDPARPDRIAIEYRVTDELKARRTLFRRLIRQRLKGERIAFLSHRPEPNLGHPCGTLRMAHRAEEGVTDGAGRVHGLRNLAVADASLFPTSMGVNPSLTIAVLALRVARGIT
ncbi:GMC oxidoreductase [Wenxinia marina]|uniref:Choline dehydrogenase n=1 Tax=Wenxinia marina DSM 24838 TaxID=1123501 RepID=A0A0D0QIJ9_9RHOB|nr:GMC family oxidoreductase [Wenxinia marina]KIQ70898.1 Choline dehydrogenase [Wenxinia marina DSM 24838]GGL56429.1 glucose-methanol-choline oxidoreductase [Wenxinia marina]